MSNRHLDNKRAVHELWQALSEATPAESEDLVRAMLAPNTAWNISHPINHLAGPQAVMDVYWRPLRAAMPNMQRDHYVLLAAESYGGDWVTATGYYRGTFSEDWLGFPVSGQPVNLRFGEFLRMEDGQIAEVYMLLDLVDMLRQVGISVLPLETGETGYVPGPILKDGVDLSVPDTATTERSHQLVHDMIDGLLSYDQKTLASMRVRDYWEPDMLWYGPAGIGTSRGIEGFEDHHQRPFLTAFPDRIGGDHKANFADGPYVASTGWPSIVATHAADYLGHPVTNKQITMRVMDWWRAADGPDGLLKENWVLLDLPEIFLQLGKDLFAEFDMTTPA